MSDDGFMSDDEDQYEAFLMLQQTRLAIGVLPKFVIERLHTLEEKLKYLEVHSTLELDVVDMCLVPGLVIPRKFKVSDFDKYKGDNCPRTHLRAYCHKMASHINNDQLFIQYFQVSLSGASLE